MRPVNPDATPLRVLTWNLYHGRADPPAGRPLAAEFAATLAGWSWDVALLQEVPPWWPEPLARVCEAQAWRSVLTSRNELLWLRRGIAARRPDLLGSWGGGCNAILVRGDAIAADAKLRLRWLPEGRWTHGVQLARRGWWVVNLHAEASRRARARADVARTAEAALGWAGSGPLVLGGDFNVEKPSVAGMELVAGHHVDHIAVRGLVAAGPEQRLPHGSLSDHVPLAVAVTLASGA